MIMIDVSSTPFARLRYLIRELIGIDTSVPWGSLRSALYAQHVNDIVRVQGEQDDYFLFYHSIGSTKKIRPWEPAFPLPVMISYMENPTLVGY